MGFFVPEPESRNAPLPNVVGPTVKLQQCTEHLWSAVVLVACQGDVSLQLTYELGDGAVNKVEPQVLDTVLEWTFVRFPLRIALAPTSQVLKYTVHATSGNLSGQIPIAAKDMEWNLVVYSCYDQRRGIGEALWRYISGKSDKAVHAILGTGDQLYNDNVWDTPELKAWLAQPEAERLARVPDKPMVEGIRRFYLGSYLRHTHFHPAAALLRNTPQINTWDDHDIFDGWGSYPAHLQTCPTFRMVFTEAQRAYLLFQNATNPQVAEADGFLVSTHTPPPGGEIGSPGPGYSFVCQLGPSVAVAVPDTRSQRSRERILKEDVLRRIVQRVMEFPPTVKHLIFVSAVPVAYPSMKVLEKLLSKAEQEDSALHKTGLAKSLNNAFGLPDLLDDVSDHWSSGIHNAEKNELLLTLRQLADSKRLRITLVSGDVHLCAFTWVASDPPAPQALDPGYMPQIVTSAIGNKPPGDFVVKYLRASVEHNRIVAIAGPYKLRETVAKFFKTENRGKSSRFLNRMNFCEMGAETSATGVVSLKFSLAVLNEAEDGVGSLLSAVVPPLLSQEQAREADAYELDELKPKAPKFNRRCCALCMML